MTDATTTLTLTARQKCHLSPRLLRASDDARYLAAREPDQLLGCEGENGGWRAGCRPDC